MSDKVGEKFNVWLEPEVRFIGRSEGERCGGNMKDTPFPGADLTTCRRRVSLQGEQLGERLGMSRAASNKHIRTFTRLGRWRLREEVKIRGHPRFYWMLTGSHSQLDSGNVAVLPVIDSTNRYLLDRIGR